MKEMQHGAGKGVRKCRMVLVRPADSRRRGENEGWRGSLEGAENGCGSYSEKEKSDFFLSGRNEGPVEAKIGE